ncbi:MAG: radical SAM protein [Bacteroidales bacterium]|nr:radical SAM protein [Bacteroidales bacterium]
MHWKLNRIQYPVYNLGKGKRIAIWVQGCSLACKNCISKTLQTKNGGKNIEIEYLVNEIVKVNQDFSGITITGGEPFQQYQQLIAFCAYIKKMTNLEIYVFSGYTLDELYQLFPDKLFTEYIDYLTDGRYEQDKHDDQNVRGSTNQQLYKFENNKAVLQKTYFKSNSVSLKVDKDKQVYLSGIPKKDELKQLSDYLNKTGINLTFK